MGATVAVTGWPWVGSWRGLVRLQGGTSAALAAEIPAFTGSPVRRVAVQGDGLLVQNTRGEGGQFDYVILAVQANQLDFLEGEQFQREKQALDKVRFDSGELWLHRDPRFLPRRTADWSALNFQTDPALERVMFTVPVNAVEPTLATAEPVLQTWSPQCARRRRWSRACRCFNGGCTGEGGP